MRESSFVQVAGRSGVHFQGRWLAFFSGCDYFRLANHPKILQAARTGINNSGLNVSASRLTTGDREIYQTLEATLTNFFDAESALLVPTGYVTNLIAAQALAGEFSHVLVDARAHPALLDAAFFLACPVLKFRHRDVTDFHRVLARCGRGTRPLVLTDGMFSHDGSTAPLRDYLQALPRGGRILVDDAHGAGVLGQSGKGTLEAEGVSRMRVIQCLTLSKAFGAYGGAILGPTALRNKILSRSRLFAASTPVPPPLAHAALGAIKLLGSDPLLRARLHANSARVKSALRAAGFPVNNAPGPIVSFCFEREKSAANLKRKLLAAGIFPPFLKYAGGPEQGYFRFVISSEHSRKQLETLVAVLKSVAAEACLLPASDPA